MCSTLARLDAASYLAHWFRSPEVGFEYFRGRVKAPAKLEGLRLHPIPFRKIRGDAAELFQFPLRKGDYAARIWLLLPWRGQEKQRQVRAEYSAAQKEFRTTQFYGMEAFYTSRFCANEGNISFLYSMVYRVFRSVAIRRVSATRRG